MKNDVSKIRKGSIKSESGIRQDKKQDSVKIKPKQAIPGIYRTFFENTLDAILIGSQDGTIHAANPAACSMLGWNEEEICNLGRKGIVEQSHQLKAAIANRKKSGTFLGELTYIKKDGTRFPVEVSSSVFSHSEGIELTAIIIRDISERKRIEKDLFDTERIYRLLTENSGLGIGYFDIDGKILMFNQTLVNDIGIKPVEYVGKNLKDILGKDASQIYLNRIKLAAGSLKPLKFEDYVQLKGKPGWYLSILSRILDQDGKVEGILVISDNINERKDAEEKLKTSEAEYRSLFENSVMGISQAHPGGKFMRINKAYAEMYGYPDAATMLSELSYDAKSLYSNKNDRKNVLDILEKNDFMQPMEFKLNKRNGDIFWALVSAKKVFDNSGKLLYLQAEHIDITNQKKLEKERYSNSLYARNLLEASLDLLVVINAEGKITDVNIATERITGINRDKLIGSDFADYFTEPDKARKGYKIVFTEGLVKDYPLTIHHSNGHETDVLYNATLFKNEAGEVQGVFAAARDISDLKKTEEKLKQSANELRELSRHVEELMETERTQIVHDLHDDLGQKLTALNMDISWLKSRIGVQSHTVENKMQGMSQILNDSFESLRKISYGLRPSILDNLGLYPAIEWLLSEFKKTTGINYSLSLIPKEQTIDNKLSLVVFRIIQESLTNVARHSHATKVIVKIKVDDKKLNLHVQDNGIGIDSEKIKRRQSFGLLGMKERARSFGGEFTIKGMPGEGTIVQMEIPVIGI